MFDKLFELGYLKSFPGGDIVAYTISCWLVTFAQTTERHASPVPLYSMVEKWMVRTFREDWVMAYWKVTHRIKLAQKFNLV